PALYRLEHARVHVEQRRREAVTVGHYLAEYRKRRRMRGLDLADDAAEIEAQLGVELARELLHAPIVGQARHVQQLVAAVARSQQRAREQRGADAEALPRPLDAERGLGLLVSAERAQLGRAAQHTVDEIAVDDGVEAQRHLHVAADEVVRHGAGETVAPAVAVEPQQM